MSIKTVLAPVTGSNCDISVLGAALALARMSRAHIQVLFLHRNPQDVLVPHVGYELSMGVVDSLVESAKQQINHDRTTARASYDAWCADSGVVEVDNPASDHDADTTVSYSEVIGDLFTNLAEAGRMVDMICLARASDDATADEASLIQAALMETGKPVVLVPGDSKPEAIKSIAIAWNGSRESARAVSLAMPLLESAEIVSVIAATSDDVKPEDVTAFADSLKWHGINARPSMFALNDVNLTQRLQDEAAKTDAQLLVMGAYSHSRLREFVLGGVTDEIINDGRMPVLMAH